MAGPPGRSSGAVGCPPDGFRCSWTCSSVGLSWGGKSLAGILEEGSLGGVDALPRIRSGVNRVGIERIARPRFVVDSGVGIGAENQVWVV